MKDKYPAIRGEQAAEICKGCGTAPIWGNGRGMWWMACECWQSIIGTGQQVKTYWETTKREREKVKRSKSIKQ